jgi:hypothetical protein
MLRRKRVLSEAAVEWALLIKSKRYKKPAYQAGLILEKKKDYSEDLL